MRKFLFSGLRNTKVAFTAGLLVAAMGLFSSTGLVVSRVSADADCDSNAIIKCGVTSASDFINDVSNNDGKNGHHDLQPVYDHQFYSGEYLSSSMYSDFASHAVAGTAYKDGRIVVNGQTVATNTYSIGRLASYQDHGGSNYKVYSVGTNTYYGNPNSLAFGSDALPVYVLFDSQGTMQFAVMKACGNPIFGPPTATSASCNSLEKTAVSGQLNTYDFTASTNLKGNATIAKYVYNFGDGSPAVTVTSNFAQAVRHTYTKAGNFTASVTEFASVPGNSNLQLTTTTLCTKTVTVTLPFYNCVSLSGAILDKAKYKYSFVAQASYGNGATFTSADFAFGDGKTQTGVTTISADKKITVAHAYAKAGNYNASAILHFMVNGKAVSANGCAALVTPKTPPTPECKPNVPVGSPECTPCQYNPNLPSNSPQCVVPETTLPNTGAGNTIAIFAAVVIGGFLVYRQLLFRRHKAAFAAAQQGTSPLPLGDPLSDAPLTDTPLAPKRRSLRRPRKF